MCFVLGFRSTYGTHFIIPANTLEARLSYLLVTDSTTDVIVTISIQGTTYATSGVISRFNNRIINIPAELRTTTSQLHAIEITATGPISVSVYNEVACTAYIFQPVSNLDMEYHIMNMNTDESYVLITGTEDDSLVDVVVQTPGQFNYGRVDSYSTVTAARTLNLIIAKYEVYFVHAVGSLTGTTITSSKPISVVAGNEDSAPDRRTRMIAQLLSPIRWGKTFTLPGLPRADGDGFIYELFARTQSSVQIGSGPPHMLEAGQKLSGRVTDNQGIVVHADQGIYVLQCVANPSERGSMKPSSIPIRSDEEFGNAYNFVAIQDSGFTHYAVVIANTDDKDGILIDGLSVTGTWLSIPNSDPPKSTLHQTVSHGSHRVRHTRLSARFAVYVYSVNQGQCAYAYPAAVDIVEVSS